MQNTEPGASFSPRQGTKFFLPMAVQAATQSVTYPLVAMIASRGEGGAVNLAGLVQSQGILMLLGTVGFGLITTGMVFGKTREGYAQFIRANNIIAAIVLVLQGLMCVPPIAHFVFARIVGLSLAIERPARDTLIIAVFMQFFFFLRNRYQVVLYNARATAKATSATLGRVALTALLSPLFCFLGWVGPVWAAVALAIPVGLEALVSRMLARRYMAWMEPHQGPVPTVAEILRFNVPLSLGGIFLTLSSFMMGAFIARAADPERMLPVYYVVMGVLSPVSFAASRLQAVAIAFPPAFQSDRSTLRYAIRAGCALSVLPLLFLLPGAGEYYFVVLQRMKPEDLSFIRLALLAVCLNPLLVGLRAHAEGWSALRKAPTLILAGHAVYLGTMVTAGFICLSLGVSGNLIGPLSSITANLVANAVIRLSLVSMAGRDGRALMAGMPEG